MYEDNNFYTFITRGPLLYLWAIIIIGTVAPTNHKIGQDQSITDLESSDSGSPTTNQNTDRRGPINQKRDSSVSGRSYTTNQNTETGQNQLLRNGSAQSQVDHIQPIRTQKGQGQSIKDLES